MLEILLSIKPCFSAEIHNGNKVVELRKRVGKYFKVGNAIHIYSSSPIKAVTGRAVITRVQKMAVNEIRQRHLGDACISEREFDAYFSGCSEGVLVWLGEVVEYKKNIPLSVLREHGVVAPQSFCYLTEEVKTRLEDYE